MSVNFSARWLDRIKFKEATLEQQRAVSIVKSGECKCVVLGLEHPFVVTLGVRGSAQQDLKVSPSVIEQMGGEIELVRRGGEATLHSPGQLVIYPIVALRQLKLGVRDYVALLMKVTQNCLEKLGISSWPQAGEPGIFTSKGKIAFFGIQVRQGITQHGLAINVSNDLSLFSTIRSCGVSNAAFDRLIAHSIDATPRTVFEMWLLEFQKAVGLDPSLTAT